MQASLFARIVVSAGCVATLLLCGCVDSPRRVQSDDEDNKPKAKARDRAAEEPPKVIDIDPATLDPDKREYYDQGYKQGLHLAEKYYQEAFKDGNPSADKAAKFAKEMIEERNVSIQAALQTAGDRGAADMDVLRACGRKAGMKEGLAKLNLRME